MSVLARMYSRASWGARYRAGFGDRSANYPLPECWTHHSVTAHLSENATVAAEKAQMRILEDIGQQRFGGGISYSFVIFPSGRIYMGIGASRRGAHTGGHNTVGIGVVFAGNYERHRPTAAAEATYAGLLRELSQVGVLRRARTNGGHKDAPGHAWNACPGRYLHARLGAINTAAARAAAPSTPATSTPALEGEVMSAEEVWRHPILSHISGNDNRASTLLSAIHQDAKLAPNRVWSQRATRDFLNGDNNANSYGFMISRIHQYAHQSRWNNRDNDYVNEDRPTTARAQLARAHQYSRDARREAREANQKIDAVADAVAALVGQIDQNTRKALEEKLAAIKTESARISAEEVAAELEVTVREQDEEEEDD